MSTSELDPTFIRLRGILVPWLASVSIKTDEPGALYLEATGRSKPEMFAAVMTKKSYVSFHYMPVYCDPGLLEGLAPELRRRMQGKSCFNVKRPDDPAVDQLQRLVEATADAFLGKA